MAIVMNPRTGKSGIPQVLVGWGTGVPKLQITYNHDLEVKNTP